MPAESGLIRLQEEVEELEGRLLYLNAYVAQAAADNVFSAEEYAGYQSLSNGAMVQQQEVRQRIGFFADAVGLAKTVLHAGAITPWTARQARERSEDRLRLLDTPVNVIPFRRPDDIRVS